ncbi:DUF4157 domain-containing protein [Sorangium sp. So ce185]|uniref:eCIS core domain-containing protein n=1 Tax=Sorangium sp. So ce185 TaxID=3133287 RepID=UPI003F5F9DCD
MPWSTLGGAATAAGVEAESYSPVAPGSQFDFARIAVMPSPVQRKPAVSSPGDPLEREADEVADKVMRMAEPAPGGSAERAPVGSAPAVIQRKCAACEDEEKTTIRRVQAPSAPTRAELDTGAAVRAAEHSGEPLPRATRDFFEPRFGHDFSRVRVHADGEAAKAAQAVQARAYTVGTSIVFGRDQYAPDSPEGKRLLAHELAHVAQGAKGPSTLRRAVAPDFRITEISPEDAANTSMIFFEAGSTTLAVGSHEHGKIAALAAPPGQNLTLNGFSSEEGSAAANDAIVQARIAAVSSALRAAGHTGTHTPVNLRTSGIGQINYRRMRAVEVLPTPVGLAAAPSGQSACAAPGSEIAPCGTALTSSLPIANATMTTANTKLANPADPDATALLAQLFSGVPRATVVSRMSALATQVSGLPANHRCHSSCDAGCGRPAYNDPPSGAAGGTMTLCPDFLTSSDNDWRARTLIHESAHGTPGFGADDVAYANTRQIAFLSPADQLRNTDSYMLLAWLLAHPGTVPVGPAVPDTMVGMSAADENSARRAVAWLESWLNYGDFDTETLYSTIHRSLPPAVAWDTSQTGDEYNRENMHRLAPIFGLTDPGAAAPFTPPTIDDKIKIAGIHDRFDQMYSAVNWQILTVTRGAAGSDAWGGAGAALPRLTQTVTVGPAFFGMAAADQVKHLVLLMATAMFGISAPFRSKYPLALDQLRQQRGLGP